MVLLRPVIRVPTTQDERLSRGFVGMFWVGGIIDLRWSMYLAIVALQVVLHDSANGTRTERV